jgi:zinc D-Ala-D-Ala carboxypeptidase
MNQLSKNFTLHELVRTNAPIPNVPSTAEIDNLKELVVNVLQPAREIYGKPITITSGFRSKEVNAHVGGATNSQHVKGEAVDITCADNSELFDIIRQLDFDQLIWEFGNDIQPKWLHVSYKKSGNRREILKAKKVNGKTIYTKI